MAYIVIASRSSLKSRCRSYGLYSHGLEEQSEVQAPSRAAVGRVVPVGIWTMALPKVLHRHWPINTIEYTFKNWFINAAHQRQKRPLPISTVRLVRHCLLNVLMHTLYQPYQYTQSTYYCTLSINIINTHHLSTLTMYIIYPLYYHKLSINFMNIRHRSTLSIFAICRLSNTYHLHVIDVHRCPRHPSSINPQTPIKINDTDARPLAVHRRVYTGNTRSIISITVLQCCGECHSVTVLKC